MGFLDFFTTKTSRELASEQYARERDDALRAKAKGFDSFITDEQAKVDALKARVDGFLRDIRATFRKHGIESHLEAAYGPNSTYEGLEKGVRRMGIKWWRTNHQTDMNTDLAFVFIEQQGEVRVDYIYTFEPTPINRELRRKVISDRIIEGVDETPYRSQNMYSDKFQSMRRYEMYDDFVDDKAPMPDWFVALMLGLKPL